MPYYFMRDTPLQALEQLMMSQPGQKPRGGGIYRSPFRYTPEDVACEYCQNYVRKHPCRLCECTCLEERIEAGVLELNAFMRDCFTPSMGPQFRKRMHQQFRERKPQFFQFFLSDAHRRRWTHWRERCWRLSDRNKAALFLLTAYESLWRRMVWKCGNDGFDFQSVRLGGIEPELYSVYQAAKAIAVGCCNITLADLASPELVTDEAFHLITGALLMAKYAFEMLYWCGIREGELLALTPADFDFEKCTVSITKSYQRLNGQDLITTPKTEKSNRIIKMPQFLADEMQDYLKQLYGIEPNDRMFTVTKSYLHREMDRGAKEAGVKRIRIHDIRHSAVSLLIDMGFSATAIADRVGHESIDITYNYAHLFPSKQTEMAEKLNMERR